MDFFIEKFKATWSLGHEALSCYNSGQLTLEEFYTLAKLWRGGLQSSNIDGNTRLCTATSATGLMANFGADGPVASYADIDQAETMMKNLPIPTPWPTSIKRDEWSRCDAYTAEALCTIPS